MKKIKRAFTLAEVLIVIGVIGVVAAITIPSLINIISEKAKKAQTDVIETRLLDGINRYSAMEDGLSQKYETTYDFLVGLSKFYKMSQICKAAEITKCIPYSKIHSSDGTKSADVKSLKTIHQFIPGEAANNYLEPASFISAQGTPFVMAIKKDCAWDMGQAMHSIGDSQCIAYLYDKNGAGLPNRLGDDSDIVGHGLTVNSFPVATLGGVKIMTNAFSITTGLSEAECIKERDEEKEKYQAINSSLYVKTCENLSSNGGDKWAYAMRYCKNLGYHLPTEQQLIVIANALYKGMYTGLGSGYTYSAKDENGNYYTIGSNEQLPSALSGLGSSFDSLWSGSEYNSSTAYRRVFLTFKTARDNLGRSAHKKAVCVVD